MMLKPRIPAQTGRQFFLSRSQAEKKNQTQCQRESPFSSHPCHQERTCRSMHTTTAAAGGGKELWRRGRSNRSCAARGLQFHLELCGWSDRAVRATLRGQKRWNSTAPAAGGHVHEDAQPQKESSESPAPSLSQSTTSSDHSGVESSATTSTEPASDSDTLKEKQYSQAFTSPISPAPLTPSPSPSSTLTADATGQLSHVTNHSPEPPSQNQQQQQQRSRFYHTMTAIAHTSRSRMMVVADKYNNAHGKRPYFTQFLCTLVIYLFGDLCAQAVTLSGQQEENDETGNENENENREETKNYDPIRTIRHLVVGGMLSIPNFKWFEFLHYHFNYRSISLSILTKVSISQIIYTPIFNTYFFSAHSLLAGNNVQDTANRVITAVPVSVLNSLMVWPLVTGLTFLYVQHQYRSLFSGVVAIGWQTYLSWLNSKAAREVRLEKKVKDKEEHAVVEEKVYGVTAAAAAATA